MASRAKQTQIPPEGFVYKANFIDEQEEERLLEAVSSLDFKDVVMHGVVAKRTVVHFGYDYGYESWKIYPSDPFPHWLMNMRDRCAAEANLQPEVLEQVLIARYPEGAAIGWHRDAPMFGPAVLGLSLLCDGMMRFRRTAAEEKEMFKVKLQRRSFYMISGVARTNWQHSLAPTNTLRYSITFRTVKERYRAAPLSAAPSVSAENLLTS